eukprot:2083584-Rhodomonas_salina.2
MIQPLQYCDRYRHMRSIIADSTDQVYDPLVLVLVDLSRLVPAQPLRQYRTWHSGRVARYQYVTTRHGIGGTQRDNSISTRHGPATRVVRCTATRNQ